MKVTLDLSEHWYIKGGIWRYGTSLARELVRILPPENVRLVCFDRVPPDRVRDLELTGASVSAGLHRQLDRMTQIASRVTGSITGLDTARWPVRGPFATIARSGLGSADVWHFLSRVRVTRGSTPLVGTIHDLTAILFPEAYTQKPGEYVAFLNAHRDNCERVIAVSDATKRDLVRIAGFDPGKIDVVYHGIDLEAFNDVPQSDTEVLSRYGLIGGGYFLSVGTLEPRKNLDLLVDAYLAARDLGKFETPLVIVGALGWKMDPFMKRVTDPQISNHVRILGFVPDRDLAALYRGAFAFAYLSLYEGFGFPPLEAMACGAPVIASNTSSLPEVVGDAGILVNPTSVKEIVEALLAVLENQDLREKLRQQGLRRAREFTWNRTAHQTLAVYERGQKSFRG